MKVPYSWLREYCDPDLTRRGAGRAARPADDRGRADLAGGPALGPTASWSAGSLRWHRTPTRIGSASARSRPVRGSARSSAAPPTSPRGRPCPWPCLARSCPDGQELGRAELRGVTSDGMILSEAELQIGDDAAGIAVLEQPLAAGTPLAEVLPIAEPVLELEVASNRVDCLGVYGVAREVHAFSEAPLAARPWERRRRGHGERRGLRLRVGLGRGPRAVSAVHGPRVHGGDDRPVAVVAEGATRGRRSAADQQRRRHHQLRDAAHGAALACVRPRPGARRRLDRAHGGRRGADDDPGRRRAQVRCRLGPGLRSRRAVGSRRDHGRRGVGGLRFDHPRAARGRDLERGQHPAHLAQARTALRGLEPVREAASPRAGDQRPAGRVEADRRAVRSEARPGDDRRRRGDARGAPRSAARPAGRGAARHADRTGALRRVPVQAGLRGRARRRRR